MATSVLNISSTPEFPQLDAELMEASARVSAAREHFEKVEAELKEMRTLWHSESEIVSGANEKHRELMNVHLAKQDDRRYGRLKTFFDFAASSKAMDDVHARAHLAKLNIPIIHTRIFDKWQERETIERELHSAQLEFDLLSANRELETLSAAREQAFQSWLQSLQETERRAATLEEASNAQALKQADIDRMNANRESMRGPSAAAKVN